MSIFLINPYILSPFVPPSFIEREFFASGYNAARVTTSSTTYSAVTSVSTTEVSGSNYAAFWQGTFDNNVASSDGRAQLFETSARQLANMEPQDITDAFSVGGIYPYEGGTNKTFQIQHSSESGSTTGIAGRALNVLKLDASDKFAYNSGTTNATADAVSVTITEPGDYLVIGSCMVGANDNVGIFDGVNTYGALGVSFNQDGSTFSPFWHMVKLTLTNETLSVRVTVGQVRQSSILALKLDKFENAYYAEQTTQASTTSTTLTNAFSNVFSVANPANYHLILGCAQLQSNSTSASAGATLSNITRNLDYSVLHFREANATTEWYPTVVARISSFATSTPEIGWEYLAESGATARLRNMAIAILDLGIVAPPISFIGSTSVTNSTTLTLPDQTEKDDLVIVASHSSTTTVAVPTGYTSINAGTQNNVRYQCSFKYVVNPADSITGLTAGTNVKHIAMVFRDIIPSYSASSLPSNIVTTGATGAPNPGLLEVLASGNKVFVSIGFLNNDNVLVDVTPPDGYTTAIAREATGTIMGAYKRYSGPEFSINLLSEDPDAFGIGAGTDAWVAMNIALNQII
jgi:hypothetical protein